jgi:hypothetical protein
MNYLDNFDDAAATTHRKLDEDFHDTSLDIIN